MKLLEILARELDEWNDSNVFYVQDGKDGKVFAFTGKKPEYRLSIESWDFSNAYTEMSKKSKLFGRRLKISSDRSTAIISKLEWEEERSRIKGQKTMTKPNKDGWIRHRGGKCPVEVGQTIDVKWRDGRQHDGMIATGGPSEGIWKHEGWHDPSEIMAWRPHKPEQVTAEQSLDVEMPAAKYFDGPIQWRDRIREIDAASKEEEARHCAAMEAYDAERASLVAKLKAEGFALIQSDEPNSSEEPAQKYIAQQDMSDPANWRAGDLVKSVYDEADDILIGGVYPLWKEPDIDGDCLYLIDSDGDKRNRCIEDYAFHSRPTN